MAEKLKLLIVDDDPHIRRLLRLYLRDSAYEVFEAGSGQEANSLFESEKFDVILLDLILPYYGGFRLCQRLRELYPKNGPHIMIMTGDDSEETRTTANDCGADDFLAKPFSAEELVKKLEKLAHERALRASA